MVDTTNVVVAGSGSNRSYVDWAAIIATTRAISARCGPSRHSLRCHEARRESRRAFCCRHVEGAGNCADFDRRDIDAIVLRNRDAVDGTPITAGCQWDGALCSAAQGTCVATAGRS